MNLPPSSERKQNQSDAAHRASRQHLRQTLRARRDALDAKTVDSNSYRIIERLTPLLQSDRPIAGYLALGNEVDIEPLLRSCQARGIVPHVPLVQADHTLLFAPLDDRTTLRLNRYGIREPETAPEHCLRAADLDTVLLPLLAFDTLGNRMGMGGGYYDRTFGSSALAHARPRLIGVAHEMQRSHEPLPSAWWDVPLDMLVTEQQIYRFDKRSAQNQGACAAPRRNSE